MPPGDNSAGPVCEREQRRLKISGEIMLAKRLFNVYSRSTLWAVAVLIILSGCTSKSRLDTGSSDGVPNSIEIAASPALITSGRTAVVEATVLSAEGTAIADEIVAFSVLPANGGFFTPAI